LGVLGQFQADYWGEFGVKICPLSPEIHGCYSHLIPPSSQGEAGNPVQIKISHKRLHLVSSWQGQRYYLSLGVPDTAINRKAAEQKARQIELDCVSGNFDPTLDKYRPEHVPKGKAQEITPIRSIWSQYMEYKSPHVSPKTINSPYDRVTSHRDKCRTDDLKDPIKFRRELLKVTTESQARRTLMQLSAACK